MPTPEAASPATTTAKRHPVVERILQGGAADAIRLTAARGTLPIPVQDLVFLQVRLLDDPLTAVVAAATSSLAGVTIETMVRLLHDPACEPILIDHFARSGRLTGELIGLAIAHTAITDATLEALASADSPDTLNLLVTNEQRVINNPALFKTLSQNPHLRSDNRRRLAELKQDFIGRKETALKPVAAPVLEAPPPEPDPETIAAAEAEATANAAANPNAPAIDLPPDDALRGKPAFQRILTMGVKEKVQLAAKGSTEERSILVRDTTKMIALQVLKNPKLSITEIASFSGMRNVHEDILRKIAMTRGWTKQYTVIHALVRNPKTPTGLAVPFLARLGVRDLKIMARDKNIPELLRRNANILFKARTERGGKRK